MPGFSMPLRSVTIFFEDGEYVGLEVELRVNVALDFYFEALAWEELADPDQIRAFSTRWAEKVLVGWNLVDEAGAPVPATAAEFTSRFEPYAIGLVIGKWLEQMGAVATPLGRASAKAGTSAGRKKRGSRSRRS